MSSCSPCHRTICHLPHLRSGSAAQSSWGCALVRASRITYVGELGWELYVPTEFMVHVYDELMSAGAAFGLTLAGYHALNSLRIEKATGIGDTTSLTKTRRTRRA